MVSVLDFGTQLLGMEGVRAAVMPCTRWSPSTPYLFSLIFVALLLFSRQRHARSSGG